MKLRVWIAAMSIVPAAAVPLAFAKEEPVRAGTEAARQNDEKAIRDTSNSFARAFERGDAKAVADFWTEEGEYVDEKGNAVRGREALAKAYAGFFAKREKVSVQSKTHSVRFLGKDTAVEDGTFSVRAGDAPAATNRFSTLYVRQDGRWLIALLKEMDDQSARQPHLAELAWLVGTWESEGSAAAVRISYQWDEGKKFLHARYSVKPKKGTEIASSGLEIIGVDPQLGMIHGWTFDSEGAVGQSIWKWNGSRWMIEAAGTQSDGSQTTATNLLTRSGDDKFTWRSVKRSLNGEELPDLPQITVHRVAKKDVSARETERSNVRH
jgi:uncharacterized protein (TIGR02246 family)